MMENLKICIAGYTDTVSVYVNDHLLPVSSLFMDAKYTCSVSPGVCRVRIMKGSGLRNKQWKKKAAFNWLSCLSGVPDFTLREAMLEANVSSICFQIDVTDADQVIDIKLQLNASGFEIVRGAEACKDIQRENSRDSNALKKIKRVYLLPLVLLLSVVFIFLIGIALFFFTKGKIWQLFLVIALMIVLFALFCYMYKRSMK